jgi:hypothetical protein
MWTLGSNDFDTLDTFSASYIFRLEKIYNRTFDKAFSHKKLFPQICLCVKNSGNNCSVRGNKSSWATKIKNFLLISKMWIYLRTKYRLTNLLLCMQTVRQPHMQYIYSGCTQRANRLLNELTYSSYNDTLNCSGRLSLKRTKLLVSCSSKGLSCSDCSDIWLFKGLIWSVSEILYLYRTELFRELSF